MPSGVTPDVSGELVPGANGKTLLRITDAAGMSWHEWSEDQPVPPVDVLREMRAGSRQVAEEDPDA